MKKVLFIIMIGIYSANIMVVSAKRGCCSHHGGVAGCNSDGRQICNDGTLSPSCTCTPIVKDVYGCTDQNADNYNTKANKDDGSCIYTIFGCIDSSAINYNSDATKDDGTCEYDVYGCTDSSALNYNNEATKDDDSCKYEEKNTKKEEDSSNGGTVLGIGATALGIYLYKKRKK